MIDHLVYAVPDLDEAVEHVAHSLGIMPSPGGRHPDWGTRNYLVGLDNGAYLEIIGPDPHLPAPSTARPFGLDTLHRPCLAAWAVQTSDITRRVAVARSRGYDPGEIQPMSRALPDGQVLSWHLTLPPESPFPNLVPFLIDWGGAIHPSTTASGGGMLREFQGESPCPDEIQSRLQALDVILPVKHSFTTRMSATISGPAGTVTLQ